MHVRKLPKTAKKAKNYKRKPLNASRGRAFLKQRGRCYYCQQPMWVQSEEELTNRFPITAKQARLLQCTGEHLIAHSEGGSSSQENIVAACKFCNTKRHARKTAPTPDLYKLMVTRRLFKGAWHGLRLTG